MPGTERIVFGLGPTKETTQSTVLFDRVKLVAAAGQYLVCVCLMADIPNEPVSWRVENVMHRDGQLDGAEGCAGVASDPGTGVDYELPDLVRDLLKVLDPKLAKIGRGIDL
jgi:hypothetical protein